MVPNFRSLKVIFFFSHSFVAGGGRGLGTPRTEPGRQATNADEIARGQREKKKKEGQ